eukprot:TRINITY_DN2568_c0_g1_i2.p1 TRINITY_DN2568_c0_g1~~TRINITY_DN2568_c0_g1_i2.p1  ORF type:complete len:293 (-),score=55.42 TRINITY_DN2568_c0_g1_i2:302-1138(-)
MVLYRLASLLMLFVLRADADPTPPELAPQFQANFTISVTNYNVDVTTNITGFVALDNKQVGGVLNIAGEGVVPLYFATNFILYPNKSSDKIQAYMFQDDHCLFEVGDAADYRFDLRIPKSSKFLRNATFGGFECMVWKVDVQDFPYPLPPNNQMWVRYVDHAVAKIEADDVDDYSKFVVEFENLQVGPFDPSVYNPPDLKCVDPDIPPHAASSMAGRAARRVLRKVFGRSRRHQRRPQELRTPQVAPKPVRKPGDPSPPNFAPQFLSNFTLVVTDSIT